MNGAITISDNAPGSPQLVELAGTGMLPLTASPASLVFGSIAVGKKSASKTLTLTNNEPTTTSFTFSSSGNYTASGSGTSPLGLFPSCSSSAPIVAWHQFPASRLIITNRGASDYFRFADYRYRAVRLQSITSELPTIHPKSLALVVH